MSDGQLEKAVLRGFRRNDNTRTLEQVGRDYVVMFNPEKFTVNNQFEYDSSRPHGRRGSEQRFLGVKPRQFSFEFLVDGVGSSGEARDVVRDIRHFKTISGFDGDIHRPTYMNISWGPWSENCVLERLDIEYTLFMPNGTPLRALLKTTFKEDVSNVLQEREINRSSPDLTHAREFTSAVNLPLMCFRIYDDPKHYFQVARANNLNTIMNVKPGRRIYFPPIEKSDR